MELEVPGGMRGAGGEMFYGGGEEEGDNVAEETEAGDEGLGEGLVDGWWGVEGIVDGGGVCGGFDGEDGWVGHLCWWL